MVKPPDKQMNLSRFLTPTKEVLLFFPQLKEKRSMFSYTMLVPRSCEEIKEKLAEFEDDDAKVPILLFFEKSKQEEVD